MEAWLVATWRGFPSFFLQLHTEDDCLLHGARRRAAYRASRVLREKFVVAAAAVDVATKAHERDAAWRIWLFTFGAATEEVGRLLFLNRCFRSRRRARALGRES